VRLGVFSREQSVTDNASKARVPLWDPECLDPVEFVRYEVHYPSLFQALRRAGWVPGQPRRPPEDGLRKASRLTVDCSWGDAFIWNFFGFKIQVERSVLGLHSFEREVTFCSGAAFDLLVSEASDFQDVLRDALGTDEALAVAESEGQALMVNDRGQAALVEQSLAAYVVGDNPFSVLSWYLFGEEHPDVRIVTLREGI